MILYWLALLISFLVTALGQVIYKYYAMSGNIWHLLISVAFFTIAPFTSYIALQKIGIGLVFIGAAVSQILVLVLSRQFLREQISRDHIISMSLIAIGLVMYALGN